MADKDLAPMLARINPVIDRWYFTDLPTARAASGAELQARWLGQNPPSTAKSAVFADPSAALAAAVAAADPADRIVVFGSFYTVGGVMQQGLPRLHGEHLSS